MPSRSWLTLARAGAAVSGDGERRADADLARVDVEAVIQYWAQAQGLDRSRRRLAVCRNTHHFLLFWAIFRGPIEKLLEEHLPMNSLILAPFIYIVKHYNMLPNIWLRISEFSALYKIRKVASPIPSSTQFLLPCGGPQP